MMRKSILLLSILIVFLSSCSDDFGEKGNRNSDIIGFDVALNNQFNVAHSKSIDSIKHSNVSISLLDQELRGDSLFLITIVEDSIPSNIGKGEKNAKVESRGNEVTSASIADIGVTANLYSGEWNDGGYDAVMYFYDEKLVRTSGWSTNYYWPGDDGMRMRCFAYSPYGTIDLSQKTGTPTFVYDVPDDVASQSDLLVASCDVLCPNGHQPIDLSFAHALTAVKFEIANTVEKITVKAVRVKGVYYKGTYTYQYCGINKDDNDDATPNSDIGNWDVDETDDKKTYEISELNKQIIGRTSENVPLNERELVMMLMPQSLPEGALIEVDLKDDVTGWEGTIKASIAGDMWEKGKCVKYVISTKDIVVEYHFDVKNNEENEFPYYGGTSRLIVDSYKLTTHVGGSLKENIGWTASAVGHIELDKYSGGESIYVDTINYILGPAPIDESSTHGALQGVVELGSYKAPYDLSIESGSRNTANCYIVGAPGFYKLPLVIGNAIQNGAQNNNSSGTPRFHGDAYYNYLGESWLRYPEVYKTQNGAEIAIGEPYIVWQDAPGLVSGLRLVEDSEYKYLAFEVNRDYICDGNAVIAVKDENGDIMWSWHIWVSHYKARWDSSIEPKEKEIHNKLYGKLNSDGDLVDENNNVLFEDPFKHKEETDITDLEIAHGSYSFAMLSKYIGFCGCEVKKYGGTNVTVELKQVDAGGQEKTVEINYADKSISTAYNACYYQWGRKDPMRPWGEYKDDNGSFDNHKTCFGNDGLPLGDEYFYEDEPAADIATTIKNPAKFYGASTSAITWCSRLSGNTDFSTTSYENLWNANNYSGDGSFPRGTTIKDLVSITDVVKTIYDPCPAGYEIPRSDAFTGFLLDNKSDDKQVSGSPEYYQGYYYIDDEGNYAFSLNFKYDEQIGNSDSNNNGNMLREPNPCAFVSGYQEYGYWFRPDVNGAGKWDGSFNAEENTEEQAAIYDDCLLMYALGVKGGSDTSNGSVKEFRHMGNALTATLVDKPNDGNNALPSRLYFFHDHNGWYPIDNTDCKGHTVPTDQTGWTSHVTEAFYNYDGAISSIGTTSNRIITVASSTYNLGFTVLPAKTGANGVRITK